MTGAGHLTIGLSVSVATLAIAGQHITLSQAVVALAIGGVASLIPDLDAPHSMLKSRILANGRPAIIRSASIRASIIEQLIITLGGMVEVVLRLFLYLLLAIPSFFLQHRAITHYLITPLVSWLLLSIIFWYFNQPQLFGLIFFVSYCSHILGDMCTYSGVAALKPFYSETLYLLPKKWRFRTLNKTWEYGREKWVMSQGEQIVLLISVVIAIGVVLIALR